MRKYDFGIGTEHCDDAVSRRKEFLKQFNPLADRRCFNIHEACNIAPGMCKAFNEPAPNGFTNADEYNRDCFGFALDCSYDLSGSCKYDIRLKINQFLSEWLQSCHVVLGPTIVDLDVFS